MRRKGIRRIEEEKRVLRVHIPLTPGCYYVRQAETSSLPMNLTLVRKRRVRSYLHTTTVNVIKFQSARHRLP